MRACNRNIPGTTCVFKLDVDSYVQHHKTQSHNCDYIFLPIKPIQKSTPYDLRHFCINLHRRIITMPIIIIIIIIIIITVLI